jgi:hypothetical protein
MFSALLLLLSVRAEVFFSEEFDRLLFHVFLSAHSSLFFGFYSLAHFPSFAGSWRYRWIESAANMEEGAAGHFGWGAGMYYGDWEAQMGLMTTEDKKYYQISADFNRTISTKGKKLIISYTIKMERDVGSGGGYIKLLPEGLDQEHFTSDDTYDILFGPDVVHRLNAQVKFIIRRGEEYFAMNDTIYCPLDELTHMYTLIIRPDCTYEIQIDGKHITSGRIRDQFSILGPQWVCFTSAPSSLLSRPSLLPADS